MDMEASSVICDHAGDAYLHAYRRIHESGCEGNPVFIGERINKAFSTVRTAGIMAMRKSGRRWRQGGTEMNKVASFNVDHDKLEKGMYISRIDGDVVTYDIRMKKPNMGDYLSNGTVHTFEHLLAACLRNGPLADAVIYIGPMGCRTGFCVLLRDTVSNADAIDLVREGFAFVADFEGEIPGSRRQECGNCLEHDLEGAKAVSRDMMNVLRNWTEADLAYE